MNHFMELSLAYNDDTIEYRRYIHKNAECGFDLDTTLAFVREKLTEFGYHPQECGVGLTCTVGKGAPCILLRADLDALPQEELTGLPFASDHEACHSCGHDFHGAMLLTAARILKELEDELQGTVKFMFQPAEEKLAGCKAMLDAGILENPKVDVAFGQHIFSGPAREGSFRVGNFLYSKKAMMSSSDAIYVHVKGKTSHGSQPENGINAASCAANIVVALQQLITLEFPADQMALFDCGVIESGVAENIIPEEALLRLCTRTYDQEIRTNLNQRIIEIVEAYGKAWRCGISIERPLQAPSLKVDDQLQDEVVNSVSAFMEPIYVHPTKGTEDFAYLSEKVPTAFIFLGGGDASDGKHIYTNHNPRILFDEEALPYGVAAYVGVAYDWLKKHHN